MSNNSQLQNAPKKDLKSLMASKSVQDKLNDILGQRAATFATSVVQIANQSAMLANAEPSSIIGAAMTAATLNLPLNASIGQAYIVPFKDNSGQFPVTKAQFILGYKGLKQLAMRSGQFKSLNSGDVREGEIEKRDRLSGQIKFNWIDDDTEREQTPIVGYFSFYELLNGFSSMFYMSVEEIETHAKKYSQTYKNGGGNWKKEKHAMSIKTVVKLHLNKGEAPLSVEMETAITKDQAIVSFDEQTQTEDVKYSDVPPEKIEIDHDRERILLLINSAITPDDFEVAKSAADGKFDKEINDRISSLISDSKTEEELNSIKTVANESHMPKIKAKQKELNKK